MCFIGHVPPSCSCMQLWSHTSDVSTRVNQLLSRLAFSEAHHPWLMGVQLPNPPQSSRLPWGPFPSKFLAAVSPGSALFGTGSGSGLGVGRAANRFQLRALLCASQPAPSCRHGSCVLLLLPALLLSASASPVVLVGGCSCDCRAVLSSSVCRLL